MALKVEGMTCAHCVAAVEKALSKMAGVKSAKADLANNMVTVTYDPNTANTADFARAVEQAGYRVVG
ncbi:MAG: copper ion binding protein [Firmicutes bacterium]|jgi:copper ion binding protein|nr:copper ion binding protein [Bacillota bacterium]